MGIKTVLRYSVPMDGINVYRFACDEKILSHFEIQPGLPTSSKSATFDFWAEHYFDERGRLKTLYDWNVIGPSGTIPDDWEYVGTACMTPLMYHLYRKEAK